MLRNPIGICVDTDLNMYMYIAGSGNNRAQFFKMGQLNGTTIVESEGAVSFALMNPTVDWWITNELQSPLAIAFDSRGNIFVADKSNRRIQKFALTNNSCGELTDHL